MCCSYDVRTVALTGSAKGPKGWVNIDTARIYFDHPYHAQIDNALSVDFVCEANGGVDRVAIELSPDTARKLVKQILDTLESGERALIAERDRFSEKQHPVLLRRDIGSPPLPRTEANVCTCNANNTVTIPVSAQFD